MTTEIYPYRAESYGSDAPNAPRLMVHELERPTAEARFAMELMTRQSIHQIATDGEDTAGRQKVSILGPVGTARRACDIADAAFVEFRAREWLDPVPTLAELADQIKNRENGAEN